MKKSVPAILFFCLLSCKTLSPDFTRQEIYNNGANIKFGKDQLKLNSISSFITKNKIGLYIFKYKRGSDDISLPVLKFDNGFILYKDNAARSCENICDSFSIKYSTLFNQQNYMILKKGFAKA